MARSVFVLFSVAIIILFALLLASAVETEKLVKKVEQNTFLIDSLQSECTIKDITIGRSEYIIDQLNELHPSDVKKIESETE